MNNSIEINNLLTQLTSFMQSFELVFDGDWEHTQLMLQDESGTTIDTKGTFLSPTVDDESNNWWNRGNLLTEYRNLIAIMKDMGIHKNYYDK